MNIIEVALYLTIFLYSFLYDWKILSIYFGIIIAYLILGAIWPGLHSVSPRKRIMFSTWC